MFSHWRLRTQLFGLVTLLLFILVLVNGLVLVKARDISGEIKVISQVEILLAATVTEVQKHQLGMSLTYERALRFGSAVPASFQKAQAAFEVHAQAIAHYIQSADVTAREGIEEANNDESRQNFEKIAAHMEVLFQKFMDLNQHMEKTLALMAKGESAQAFALDSEMGPQADALNQGIGTFQRTVLNFTQNALHKLDQQQDAMLLQTFVLSLVGLLVIFVVAHMVIGSIRRRVEGIADNLGCIAEDPLSVPVKRVGVSGCLGDLLTSMEAVSLQLQKLTLANQAKSAPPAR